MDKLSKMLQFAANYAPYYRKVLSMRESKSDILLSDFPILTKQDIVNNRDALITAEYSNMLLKECAVHLTSGSAGAPIEIFWHYNDEMHSTLPLWRLRKKHFGITPNCKLCTLHTTTYSWTRTANISKIAYSNKRTILSLCKLFFDDNTMQEYYNEIMRFKPDWLLFQPSFFVKLMDYIIRYKLQPPNCVQYVEFVGEAISAVAIDLLHKLLPAEYAEIYGTMEVNAIAYRCPFGHMHLIDDNVFIELKNDAHLRQNTGNLLVTSLTNHIMPLVRYEIGDVAELAVIEMCECGISGQIISSITGREQADMTLGDGKIINERLY
jgi:phenylacetate-CoA ligase